MPNERSIDPFTPRQFARITAAFVAIVIGALGLLLEKGPVEVTGFWRPALLAFVGFGATYIAVLAALERYIKARLRLLFRLVHDLRAGGGHPVEMDRDVLGQMRETVEDWAHEKRTEIAELKSRENYRREFIGNLSHELKTPLFNIQGYVETLLDGALDDPAVAREFLGRAARGADRLRKIVEDLDMISRLESGVMEMTPEPVDLNALVGAQLSEASGSASASGMRLINAIEGNPRVLADPQRLEQVFTNLIENAVRYGRDQGSVEIRAFDLENDQVLIEVSDNGIGIAEEHLPRLFERFFRVGTSRARNEGGSGLGLAIVKHIVEAHGGTITVKSVVDQGTTFSFTLPKAR